MEYLPLFLAFTAGYSIKRIDAIIDRGEKHFLWSIAALLLGLAFILTSAPLAPHLFGAVIVGVLLAKKIDNPLFILLTLISMPALLILSAKVNVGLFILYAAGAYADELYEGNIRPFLKAATFAGWVLFGDMYGFLLLWMFDGGYKIAEILFGE